MSNELPIDLKIMENNFLALPGCFGLGELSLPFSFQFPRTELSLLGGG